MRFFGKVTAKLSAVIVFFCVSGSVQAQSGINADSLLQEAQQAAQQGKYNNSRRLAEQVLQVAPEYTDAALLLGYTYAWEQKYDSANAVLQPLLTSAPQNAGVYLALAKVALWSAEKPEQVLAYAKQGLALAPESGELKEYQIRALVNLHRYKEAEAVFNSLLHTYTRHQDIKKLLEEQESKHSLRTEYQFSTFDQDIPNWHLAAVEYTRLLRSGSLTGRVNYANRFEQNALQGEVDYWPHLNEKTYLYLNAGFSSSELFPDYRAGLEVYRKLPLNLEASLGARALVFPEQTVWLYTGHLGAYFSNYWAGFRQFVQYQQGTVQATSILQVRRYFRSPEQHLTLTLSRGSTPTNQVGLQEISRIGASRVGLESRFRLSNSFYWGALLQYEHEELSEGRFRNRYTSGLSLQYRFN